MTSLATPAQSHLDGSTVSQFEISVLRDFSDDPFGRYPTDGPNSGERFREEFLRPALQQHNKVHVDLNGNLYGSSFLEEAFGGLVRKGYATKEELSRKLTVSHSLESFEIGVWRYINAAELETS